MSSIDPSPFYIELCRVGLTLENKEFYSFCKLLNKYQPYIGRISSSIYEFLDGEDQKVFVDWFFCRWGDINLLEEEVLERYKLDVSRESNHPFTEEKVGNNKYHMRNFSSQGHDFDLVQYDWVLGIHDILYDQYEHKDVGIKKGDVIIDGGAFIGDTAVLFAEKLNKDCSIHSFELDDENLLLMEKNIENNKISDRVFVNKLALSNESGKELSFSGANIQGAIKIGESGGNKIKSITIDDYVNNTGLDNVDFIKMDIEGSELVALQGAAETIRKYKPNLAICLYHKWQDPFEIPEMIQSLGVGYKLRFKWVHLLRGWEAVLLATEGECLKRENLPADAFEVLEAINYKLSKEYCLKYDQADDLWRKAKGVYLRDKVISYGLKFRKAIRKIRNQFR